MRYNESYLDIPISILYYLHNTLILRTYFTVFRTSDTAPKTQNEKSSFIYVDKLGRVENKNMIEKIREPNFLNGFGMN